MPLTPGAIFLVRRYRLEAIPRGGPAYSETILETVNCFRRDWQNCVDMMIECVQHDDYKDHNFVLYRVVEEIMGHSGNLDALMGDQGSGEVKFYGNDTNGLSAGSLVAQSGKAAESSVPSKTPTVGVAASSDCSGDCGRNNEERTDTDPVRF
jgi:hypothetical protein